MSKLTTGGIAEGRVKKGGRVFYRILMPSERTSQMQKLDRSSVSVSFPKSDCPTQALMGGRGTCHLPFHKKSPSSQRKDSAFTQSDFGAVPQVGKTSRSLNPWTV